jgi:hypothetical protein
MALTATQGQAARESDSRRLDGIVDLKRYPIDAPESPAYRQMLAAASRGLETTGACVFEGFMRAPAVRQTLAEIDPLSPGAFVCGRPHNVYLVAPDPAYPADHPRNRQVRSVKAGLADDEIPANSPVRAIYEAECFRSFLCQALKIDRLFAFDDPLGSINVGFYGVNQELGWHFDNSVFTVTIMLRQSESGGLFEYAPNIREESPAGFDVVQQILDGRSPLVRELKQDPGALVLFKGSRSLHRVTPSFGPLPRTIAILSYAPVPNYSLTEHNRQLFYGRSK